MPALVVLCAARLMVILDITAVSLALPWIQVDLAIAIKAPAGDHRVHPRDRGCCSWADALQTWSAAAGFS